MEDVQPLLVSIDTARAMVGGIGKTTIYEWLADGRLESRKIGKRRLILVSSIRDLIDRAEG